MLMQSANYAMTTLAATAPNPLDHVVNHTFGDNWTSAAGNLVLSGIILIVLGLWCAKRIATGPESQGTDRYVTKNTFAHMVEVICVYLREDVVRPLLGTRTNKLMPFLWTLFFFVLVNNLLGMVPIMDALHLASPSLRAAHESPLGGTATQSLYVTGTLALICGLVINGAGIKELGLGGYLHHLTAGAPPFVWPIIVPVEIMGTFIKPIALAIRLFANMTAGHTLVATLFGFIGLAFTSDNLAITGGVTLVSGFGVIAIMFLELLVAFLQAFLFMFLSTVFISLLAHHDDHEHDHAEHLPAAA